MSKKLFILPGLNGDSLFLEKFKQSLEKASLTNNLENANVEDNQNKVTLERIHSGSKRIIPINNNEIEDVQIHESKKDINFILVDDKETVLNQKENNFNSNQISNINISTAYIKKQWDIEIIEYPKNQIMSYPELQEYVFQKVMIYDEFYVLAESFSGPIAASLVPLCQNNIKAIIFVASFVETPLLLSRLSSRLFGKLPYMNQLHKMPFEIIKKMLLNNYHDEYVEGKIKEFLATAKEEVIYSRIKEMINLNHSFLNSYNDSFVQFNGKVLSIVAGQDNLLYRLANLPFLPMSFMKENFSEHVNFSARIADRIPQTQIMFFPNAPHMILELYPDKMAKEIMNWIDQH